MSKQKKIRRADYFYDDVLEEKDIQAITREQDSSIYERAARKPWKWMEYIKFRLKLY
jgi:hypothetical protein